jgi:hypothetical protein
MLRQREVGIAIQQPVRCCSEGLDGESVRFQDYCLPWIEIISTSKMSVALGPMSVPIPRCP